MTQLGHTGMKPSQALRADSPVPVFANRQAESRQRIQHATVGVGLGPTLDFTETIGEEGQRTPGGDARVEVIVGGPSAFRIAQHLAGWGTLVEVVEPAEVCDHLARIGRELVQRYPGPRDPDPG